MKNIKLDFKHGIVACKCNGGIARGDGGTGDLEVMELATRDLGSGLKVNEIP